MQNRSLKLAVLLLILSLTVAFTASCDVLFGTITDPHCTHDSVSDGDCQNVGKCDVCGEPIGELGTHVYESKVVAPDCTEKGYTEYVCKVCGDSYKNSEIPALGHDFGEWVVTKQPTADDAGVKTRECTRCDERETDSVPAHQHTLANAEAKLPTCTDAGWEKYTYCTVCEYSTKVLIEAIGHSYGDYVSVGNGKHERVCQNDPSHVLTEPCSGGTSSGADLPVCEYCNTEYELTVRLGNSTYGYYALGAYANGENMQRLYKDLIACAEEFLVSGEDLTLSGEYYVIGEFDYSAYSLSVNEASAVWKVFYVSNPAYYWLDASIVTSNNNEIFLTVADIYASASYRRTCDAAIAAMTEECASLIESEMTDLEKAMQIAAYIVANMEYAYEADGVTPVSDIWAHNMAGFAMHGFGVCEAYAKSFMYLCLQNGVNSIIGSGYGGGERHAWNYVELDSVWYGADITWTDKMGDAPVYDDFGLSVSDLFADHTSHQSEVPGGDFIYPTPKLSDTTIELTVLYKNSTYAGVYKSIDDAFAVMTDSTAEYVIYIGFYSTFEGAIVHNIKASATPSVKKLTIIGTSEFVGEGYLDNNSEVNLHALLILGSDIEMRNLRILCPGSASGYQIELNKHTLTLGGDSMYVNARVVGTEQGSTVITRASRGSYLHGGAEIYLLDSGMGDAIFGQNSNIQFLKSGESGSNIYTTPGVDVNIEKTVE